MIVSCPKCQSKYNIPESKIGNKPKRFRCRKCSEIFVINPPDGAADPESDASSRKDSSAARFARVLASDMLIYNRELVEEARENGNLRDVLKQEISKSWELWQSRFPEASESDPDIFSDALNQYLANGEKIFRKEDFQGQS